MIEVNELNPIKDKGPVLGFMDSMNHEQIVFCQDKETGLKAIIGVHSTVLGPSLGGTRMWAYDNEEEAIKDALRLSRGMTYKNSLAGLNLGGGKAVIIGDSRTLKTPDLMRKFGEFVDRLNGKYITAEDVGMTTQDMVYIRERTKSVVGLPREMGGTGDPSPFTALGVYMGMKACAKEQWGSDSLSGKNVLVQGAGNVGQYLMGHLVQEGAKVMVSDIYEDKLSEALAKYPNAQVIEPTEVYDTDMDIYAPCALGATVNSTTLPRLKCAIIAGAANNQLEDETVHGQQVMESGIIYAPDYLINSGGVINCFAEVDGLDENWVKEKTEGIYQTTSNILKLSKEKGIPTYQAANLLAEERVEKARK